VTRLSNRSTTEEATTPTDPAPEWIRRKKKVLPEKVATLRYKLYQKAKHEPKFRFYALYDRVFRSDVLQAACGEVFANGGAPGPDGVTIDQIVHSEGGAELLVKELHEELKARTYKPGAVRRVYIPKANGKQRPLGIPNVRDRVVQAAVLLVIEPIFEAIFEDSSYGFRPERSAHDALAKVRAALKQGQTEVYDADLQSYFDTIPHDKLMTSLRVRITDNAVLRLIEGWLRAVVVETDGNGRPKGTRPTSGTPQGGVISPLLANIYLHWLDHAFRLPSGPGPRAPATLVRFADDFVILAEHVGTEIEGWVENILEKRLGLTLNRDKTRKVDLTEGKASFDFLGFTFRFDRDLHGRDKRYLNVVPSEKALAREREKLRGMISTRQSFVPIPTLIERVSRHLKGWREYFDFGYPRVAFREVNSYVRERLTHHLKRRSQRPFQPPKGQTYYAHLAHLGLVYL
jgi:RNA-directed DNA polymerase